ncbi:hypothetical protein DXT91_24400 [Agrobacterium tumefaciens]|nr:hypothetical protein [Agrobacterium tumefaciens]
MEKFGISFCNFSAAELPDNILVRARIHTEMVRRIVSDPMVKPFELVAFLQEVALGYLMISEELNRLETEARRK